MALLDAERERVEAELAAHVAEHPALGPDLALLQTVPGVGPRAAAAFLAETAGRAFGSPEDVAAYAGVCPKRSQSRPREAPSRLPRRGNARLRARFYMPAVVAKAHNPQARALYERLLARGLAKKAAVLACERKLLMVCHAVLRTQTPYDPTRGLT
jgi:transposase